MKDSSAWIWRLTADCVRKSSAAARVKLKWRAADSKPRRRSSGGSEARGLCMRLIHARDAYFSFVLEGWLRHSACVSGIHQGVTMQLNVIAPQLALDRGQVLTLDDAA